MRPPLLLATLLLAACAHTGGAPTPDVGAPSAERPPPAALRWVKDDYAAARDEARRRGVPLFVDLWAPWCHTCLSMKQTVFTDPAMAPLAGRFVWLAMDTDRPDNAAALERFPPEIWPTFYVIDPVDETVHARYGGAMPLARLRRFLLDGERAVLAARADRGDLGPGSPLAHLREGQRRAAAGDYAGADAAWAAALEAAPPDWPRAPEVLVGRVRARYRQQDDQGCVSLALTQLPRALAGRDASGVDFCVYAQLCAQRLGGAPALARKVHAAIADAAAGLGPVLADPTAPLSVDDRAEGLRVLRLVLIALDRREEAVAVARRQRALLDRAAQQAPTPTAAMTHSWPRAEVYAFLGVPGELVADLERLAAALPDQYDPPYRLAWILRAAGRPADAVAPAERAAELAYGPRRVRILDLLATLHRELGDAAAEAEALRRQVAALKTLTGRQADPARLGAVQRRLEALDP